MEVAKGIEALQALLDESQSEPSTEAEQIEEAQVQLSSVEDSTEAKASETPTPTDENQLSE